ncbi:histidine kinase [Dyadobacter jejuensis]|uniref:Histidine kinase n=1 Tax=Dyadobacter jejuensis TaxID=1082580 RepID=A0A316ALG3_9BACT|nr:sensor histidine kinase [Dyadobacter jejuensis]PWJ57894.1 histidine kinase [Dyadobacter jejuensis]
MKYFERYLLLLGMLVFLLSPFLLSPFSVFEAFQYPQYQNVLLAKIVINVLLIGVFIFNLKVLTPRLLDNKRAVEFAFVLLALLVCFLVVDTFLMRQVQSPFPGPGLGNGPIGEPRPPRPRPDGGIWGGLVNFPQLIGNLILFLVIVLSSSILVLLRERLREEDLRKQILYEKVKAELSVLKLQISPHFLFNTLNNIRYLARRKSDKTEEAVVELAQLLRYMIYQVNDDRVPLSKEIEYLQRYIKLQQMRLQAHTQVHFKFAGNAERHSIEPLLFIPFVENAFKYGVHAHEASNITIELTVSDTELHFLCENSTFGGAVLPELGASGVGIANVKKRLQLYYPHRHRLSLSELDGKYGVDLTLQLTHG